MATYYAAVDMGASSGRLILGHMENGKMELEEIHRFENGMVKKDGELCWEFDRIFTEIVAGLKKCKEIGKIPVSMGVDTWGVDFVLLDKEDKVLGNTVGYRDHRTEGMDEEVYKFIPVEELYARTGIQKAIYNTIYQLMAVKTKHPEYLEKAETLLHVPDYFHFLLTGQKTCEYTEATTGQMVNAETKDWDYEIIDKLGYPRRIFQKLIMPHIYVTHSPFHQLVRFHSVFSLFILDSTTLYLMGNPEQVIASSAASLSSWLLRLYLNIIPLISHSLSSSWWVILPSFPCQHLRNGDCSMTCIP